MLQGSIQTLSVAMMGACFILLPFILIVKRKKTLEINKNIFIIFYILSLLGTLSALVNEDVGLIINLLAILGSFIGLVFALPNVINDDPLKLIYRAILISHIPIVFIPILSSGLKTTSYTGMFNNSNAFGSVAATLFIVCSALLVSDVEKIIFDNKKLTTKNVLLIVTSAVFFALTAMSSSRASAVTAIAILILNLLIMVSKHLKPLRIYRFRKLSVKKKTAKNLFMKGVPTILLFTSLWILTPLSNLFEEGIIDKFIVKQDMSGGILASRQYTWITAIEETKLFGHGNNYFQNFERGAHNTFISLLGQYGLLFVTVFIILLLIGVYYSIQYALEMDSDYRYLPISLISTFMFMSMAEGMMLKLSMVSTFACLGIVSNYRKKRKKSLSYKAMPA